MSIMRAVLRMATVAALRNITIAEARVYDSDNTPLNDALKSSSTPKPYITVYTDDDVRTNFSGKDIFSTTRELALVIEVGVMGPMKLEGETDAGDVVIPATDSSLDLSIDILETQCLGLLLGNPLNPWGELVRTMLDKVSRSVSTRGASGTQGARWAARQIILRCDTIQDVPPGVPIPSAHPIRRFIELAREDTRAALAGAGAIVEATLTRVGDETPSWAQAQSWLGLTREGVDAIGIAPLTPDFDEGPPVVEATPAGEPLVLTLPNGEPIPDFWPKPGEG